MGQKLPIYYMHALSVNERKDTNAVDLKDNNYLFKHTQAGIHQTPIYKQKTAIFITQSGNHQTKANDTEEQTYP